MLGKGLARQRQEVSILVYDALGGRTVLGRSVFVPHSRKAIKNISWVTVHTCTVCADHSYFTYRFMTVSLPFSRLFVCLL